MTYEEALKNMDNIENVIIHSFGGYPYTEEEEFLLIALDRCKEAIEKQIPKKPIEDDWAKNICYCPNCKRWFNGYHKPHHCKCGQAILWE